MKVVVNADDFGASKSTNEAIDYAFRNSIINRTTIMVTSPYCEDAMQRAFDGNYAGSVGLHLHLDGANSLTQDIREYNLSSPSFVRRQETGYSYLTEVLEMQSRQKSKRRCKAMLNSDAR